MPNDHERRWRPSAADVVDVFVYVVVLNLAAEYLPLVITDTFTVSLLTSVLLKGVLEVVVAIKDLIKVRMKAASSAFGKVTSGLLLWLTLVSSKVVVLELVAFFFGDSLHHSYGQRKCPAPSRAGHFEPDLGSAGCANREGFRLEGGPRGLVRGDLVGMLQRHRDVVESV